MLSPRNYHRGRNWHRVPATACEFRNDNEAAAPHALSRLGATNVGLVAGSEPGGLVRSPHCRVSAGGLSMADMDGSRSGGYDSTLQWRQLQRQPRPPLLHSTRADALSYEPPQRCRA
jgi:hypothetical protein